MQIFQALRARTYVVFPVLWNIFKESIWLLYFVSRMYAKDKNDCWHPRNHDKRYDVINMVPIKNLNQNPH